MKKTTINWHQIFKFFAPYFAILLLTTIIISTQLVSHATFITADRYFHFSRFYDAAEQIKTGNFSYFQNNITAMQSGRIINALYGPFFAYLNGLLVLLSGSWFTYQIIMDYLVYLIGGMAVYRMMTKVKVREVNAILLALLYLTLGIMPGWLRADNFMAWGAALAPYVVMCGIDMIQDKNNPVHWVKLMLIMAIIAQIHLLSTVILALSLVPFAIYSFVVNQNKKAILLNFIKAVAGTIVLTANFWGAFLLLYRTNKIALPKSFGLNSGAVHISASGSEHGQLTILVFCLFIAQICYVLFHLRENKLNTFVTLEGAVLLLVSSRFMPWHFIQTLLPGLGRSFQFPYRLIVAAYPLLFLGMGLTLEALVKYKKEKLIVLAVLVAALVQTTVCTIRTNVALTKMYNDPNRVAVLTTYYQIDNKRQDIKGAVNGKDKGLLFKLINRTEPDYLPIYKKHISPDMVNLLYRTDIIDQSMRYNYSVHGSSLYLSWVAKKSDEVQLPLVMYHQSRLQVNNQIVQPQKLNPIGSPTVNQRKGNNTAILSFIVPMWFWGLVIISLVGWLVLFLYGLKVIVNYRFNQN
ncbi:cell division protein [Lactobacillus sp. PV034]|uniref:cell division protein n=1 Tax=Lactobacillus sp. PV034 TaxID=2594495 RepID=UPI00223F7ED5|nr:cell division protein [Lactobacillus sp. PV034]QNQ80991.1 cell division protein [Lactobacillus sp. PV034]